jgi:hypothetical protein
MNKEFIPYKQALALKQLGFNESCFGYYVTVEVPNPFLVTTKISDTQGGYFTFAPLYQQVFRWFREKYTIDSIVQPTYLTKYQYRVFKVEAKSKVQIYGDYMSKEFNTYEEAELACLIKLIEIVKENNKQHDINRIQ